MENLLFPVDEVNKVEEGPVTCLGITFNSDTERREYFRNELRKKLPELKNIEGFPNGEDEDIIALSDPPYYTACPNPWINDFINQWEEEKKELQAAGKRTESFEVKEPYASDVSEGKNNPIYNAHSYHTKVPHPAIMRYILHYTQPGDIIYDGFCGTGMTGVAAGLCDDTSIKLVKDSLRIGKRHAILSDLSPVASLIASNYNTHLTHSKIFDDIEKELALAEKKYEWMYETKHSDTIKGIINYTVWSDIFLCPDCGKEYDFYHTAVNSSTNEVYKEYECPHCHSRITKDKSEKSFETHFDHTLNESISRQKRIPVIVNYSVLGKSYFKDVDQYDIDIINKSDTIAQDFKYFTDRMPEGNEGRRNDRQGITHVHHFYFSRSLVILEYLFKKAKSKEFRFLLNSQLVNISKLNRYRPGVSFPYNPLSGTLYIGSQLSEANVFIALRNKIKKLRTAFEILDSQNVISVASATAVGLKDNTVDYIFTDPPFGSNFSYSELNALQETWLRVRTNSKPEAIVNVSVNKHTQDYQQLMYLSFKEYYRVLKPGRWMTVEFSNTSATIWNTIQLSLQQAGFIVSNVAALDKQQGSFKAVTSPTAVKQDLIITCYKPTDELADIFTHSYDTSANVWDFVEELLEHLPVHLLKDNSTTAVIERSPKILFDRLIAYYVQHGYAVPMNAAEFQKGLKERFVERDGMYFTAEQAIEYEDKKKETTSFVSLALLVGSEAEGIEWIKRKLEKEPLTYSDILPDWMQDLVTPKKGDKLPELMQILEENFLKDDNGYWHIPDINDQAQKEAMKTKRLMKEFAVYVEAKKVKEARLEALRCGFKECYKMKDFATIVAVGNKIPESLLMEDEVLLQYYDIAASRV
ncbi:MAG: DNA methylase [Bacteroidales bacterium]|nr:DNA methylase [Bacteroidales bacterium]